MAPHPYIEQGAVYGNLTVLRRWGTDSGRKSTWLCKCICGTQVIVRGTNLDSGGTQSCGCQGKGYKRRYRNLAPIEKGTQK